MNIQPGMFLGSMNICFILLLLHLSTGAVRQDENYDEDGGGSLSLVFAILHHYQWCHVVLVVFANEISRGKMGHARPGTTPS